MSVPIGVVVLKSALDMRYLAVFGGFFRSAGRRRQHEATDAHEDNAGADRFGEVSALLLCGEVSAFLLCGEVSAFLSCGSTSPLWWGVSVSFSPVAVTVIM